MNKILLSAIALLCAAAPAVAQVQKINALGRIELYTLQMLRSGKISEAPEGSLVKATLDDKGQVAEPVVGAIVRMNPGCTVDVLSTIPNVTVTTVIDSDMATVSCPLTVIEAIAALPEVKSVSVNARQEPMLNFARPAGNVSTLQDGTFKYNDAVRTFTGKGVVCGMMDTGLDANHINFKNSDGTSRISRLWHFTSSTGASTEYNAATISGFTTDNSGGSHATHVAGIIGGSYKGNGSYGLISAAGSSAGSLHNNQPMPYYGVATEGDLAFAVGGLYDANVIGGVTKIVEYAESQSRPCVINMSLGSTTGPHDGTDDYTEALNRLASRAVICMSAGNDGDVNLSINKTISSASGNNSALKTFVAGGSGNGYLDVWSSNNSTVRATWYLYDTNGRTLTEICQTNTATQTVSSSSSSDFAKYFSGSITMTVSVDPNNNRFNVHSYLGNVNPLSTNTTVGICLWIENAPVGTELNAFGSSNLALSNKPFETASSVVGYTAGTPDNSINNACCAPNIISVGSFNSSKFWMTSGGLVYSMNSSSEVGEISVFSSYGTAYNGTQLPLICGPGSPIVSSYSRYYNAQSSFIVGSAVDNGTSYPWGVMQGTSMSCPFVSGTVGLWMQADPTLDATAVKDIISTQSSSNLMTTGPRWGAGKIDGAKAMSYILENRAAIGDITADHRDALMVTRNRSELQILLAGANSGFTAQLVDLQGRTVASHHATQSSSTFAVDAVAPGIYILVVTTPDATARHTAKLTL